MITKDPRSGFDILADGVGQDLATTIGFATAIRNVLRCKCRALFYVGLPCNSFTFMTSSRHQRSAARPYGCEAYKFVVEGNMVAARSCLLIALSVVRGLSWFLENPKRSACIYLPYLRFLLAHPALNAEVVTWWGPNLSSICSTQNVFGKNTFAKSISDISHS